jgi:hypothetical protein
VEQFDQFGSETETFTRWNDCQADRSRLSFEHETGSGRDYLRNHIDGALGNVDHCAPAAIPEVDRLGPSLIEPKISTEKTCPISDKTIQRNELRFRDQSNVHPADLDHWYSITFKLVGTDGDSIPDCGSIRWVNAQWKYNEMGEGANDSPFLAQRFDNGVLHVTVEDGFCRCMIARAPGDPEEAVAFTPMASPKLRPVKPLNCKDPDGKICNPPHLQLLAAQPEQLVNLPDPKQDWVTMTYRVMADRNKGALFDIYANGRFIVRANGSAAAGIAFPNRVKFKFGHYRDKVNNRANLLVDRICVSQDVHNCEKTLQPVPW